MQTSSLKVHADDLFGVLGSCMQVGCWAINVCTNDTWLSDEFFALLGLKNMPLSTSPDALLLQMMHTADKHKFQTLIDNCKAAINQPQKEEIRILKSDGCFNWYQLFASATPAQPHKPTMIVGGIMNIDEQKKRELALEAALILINKQNDKLKDFTHIVSHNLRSHTGNLKMIAGMIDLETDPAMKLEWLDHIKALSDSLDETVNNLREIANSTVSLNENKKHIAFRDVYRQVITVLPLKIKDENIKLNADFSGCEYIEYVPAYLESILLNLMTNAIKYKHPRRHPEIFIKSYYEDSRPCLEVADNGLGIDMKANGTKLFKMNETFHNNADARGIGLYITKNQIEKLGGGIEVNSELNKGTTFKIKF